MNLLHIGQRIDCIVQSIHNATCEHGWIKQLMLFVSQRLQRTLLS
jgi:hypothetical protein